jgi:hypothetical protein
MTKYCLTVTILIGEIKLKKRNKEYVVNNKEHDKLFEEYRISSDQV